MFQLKKRGFDHVPASVKQALSSYRPFMVQLLYNRGITSTEQAQRYLYPSKEQMHNPLLMHDMQKAVEIIQQAREENLPVCVYGDYDADGICATVLLSEALTEYGLCVATYTPERSEGYGLNKAAIENIAASYRLLITVDLGITNHSEVRYAKELGLTVIVTDHHNPDGEQSPADAVLNPKLPGYPFDGLCGTGVAYKLVHALGFSWETSKKWLQLVAIATVADIVPLRDENRCMVFLGLEEINNQPAVGIAALIQAAQLRMPIQSDVLGFQIGPRLNAAGRLASPSYAVKLLKAKTEQIAHEYACRLNDLNTQRQFEQNQIVEEALQQAYLHDFTDKPLLIVKSEKWKKGLIGLAAGALCKRFGCPVAVFALSDDNDSWVGSFRGISTTNIASVLLAAKHLAVRSGGHKMAGGATVSVEHFEAYCDLLQEQINKIPKNELIPQSEYDAELCFCDLSIELAEDIQRLAPFGCENPLPVILSRNIRPVAGKCHIVGKTQNHLQMLLEESDQQIKAIAFGWGTFFPQLQENIDILYQPDINEYMGYRNLQLRVEEIWPHHSEQIHCRQTAAERIESMILAMNDLLLWKKQLLVSESSAHICEITAEEAYSKLQTVALNGERGHLLVTRNEALVKKFDSLSGENGFRTAIGESDQVLSLSTLLLHPHASNEMHVFPEQTKHWHHIWLLDGEYVQNEATLWAAHHPQAMVYIVHSSDNANHNPISICLSNEEQQLIIDSVQVAE